MPTTMSCQNGLICGDDHRVLQQRHQKHAEESAEDRADAAGEAGAAQNHGGDDLELDALAREHHRGVQAGRQKRSGEPCKEAHDQEEAEHRPVDIDAGELCGPGVAADVIGLAEIARAADEEGEEDARSPP